MANNLKSLNIKALMKPLTTEKKFDYRVVSTVVVLNTGLGLKTNFKTLFDGFGLDGLGLVHCLDLKLFRS